MNILEPLKVRYMILLIAIGFLSSCSVQKTGTAQEWQELQSTIQSGEWRVDVQAVYPANTAASQRVINDILINTGNSAARIDVNGEGYFLKLENNVMSANLPFFGERRQGGSYGGTQDAGIVFEDSPEDFEVKADEQKYRYDIDFDINDGTENYNATMIVFANKNVVLYLNSVKRTRMEYRGNLEDVSVE